MLVLALHPQYDLDVDGIASMNVVIIPSLNVTGFIDPYGDDFNVVANEDIYVTVNQTTQDENTLFQINQLQFESASAGLNQVNSDYQLSFIGEYVDSVLRINAKDTCGIVIK